MVIIGDVIHQVIRGQVLPRYREISADDFANHPLANALGLRVFSPIVPPYKDYSTCMMETSGHYAGYGVGWVSVPIDDEYVNFDDAQSKRKLVYFQFAICEHDYRSYPKGNCLYEYKCKHCDNYYQVDSSG